MVMVMVMGMMMVMMMMVMMRMRDSMRMRVVVMVMGMIAVRWKTMMSPMDLLPCKHKGPGEVREQQAKGCLRSQMGAVSKLLPHCLPTRLRLLASPSRQEINIFLICILQ